MSIPIEIINKVRNKGLLKYASKFTTLEKSNNNLYVGRCPHPDHNDSDPSFRIFIDQSTGFESWACMGCHCGKKDNVKNYGTDNIAFVRWMSAHSKSKKVLSFFEAVTVLANFYNISMTTVEDKNFKKFKENADKADQYSLNLINLGDNSPVHKYLNDRGLDYNDIVKWKIGFNGDRITFPIMDSSNNVIGFSNRAFSQESLASGRKYINSKTSEIFNKKNILYGINHFNNNRSHILFTEGQMDVILAHKYGVDFAVATMSCHLSENHIEFIKKSNKIPILCFDSDSAGENGINTAIKDLQNNGIETIKVLPLPIGHDLADTALRFKENLPQYVINNLTSYCQYQLSKISDEIDVKVNNIYTQYFSDINKILNNIKNPIEKNLMQSYIKKRLHIWT